MGSDYATYAYVVQKSVFSESTHDADGNMRTVQSGEGVYVCGPLFISPAIFCESEILST